MSLLTGSSSSGTAPGTVNMYTGLATDVMPPLPSTVGLQKLAALAGRGTTTRIHGTAYITTNDIGGRSDLTGNNRASTSEYECSSRR